MKYCFAAFAVFLMLNGIATYANGHATVEKVSQKMLLKDTIQFDGEKHFANVRFDGKYLIFQKTNPKEGIQCDQIWMGKLPTTPEGKFEPKLVSTGTGRTTCAYFYPDGKHILYGSTHLANTNCPPVPDRSKYGNKYIWAIYEGFDIFKADLNGNIVKRLTSTNRYDAEATISPKGDKILFTSMRDGDLDLYTMDLNGKHVKRITNQLGYDGGAWYSPDGTKIIWRASRPTTESEIKEYKELLAENLVAPTHMEVWIANADGSNAHQITFLEQANWAPNFTPDGKHVIFCSNHEYKRGFPFNMYLTDLEGNGKEKISRDKGFDAFPMFSPDGKKFVFCSNRNNGGTRDTNIFIADWVE
jgi:Tol biopolymer transport system component